jgi:Na+/H+-dicarboxylate symporter
MSEPAARENSGKRGLSLSGWIFLALGGGIACGLFFGERAAILQGPADIFIRLLQMAVLP